ncbi:hypothetical protein N483_23980 [Pseudoalteromonas luteoviolacea NCIMB 1944]|nr:hypothetical protein N483_23980 [Pseudoalteromonas luteoviolacea NCIMB 1944]
MKFNLKKAAQAAFFICVHRTRIKFLGRNAGKAENFESSCDKSFVAIFA